MKYNVIFEQSPIIMFRNILLESYRRQFPPWNKKISLLTFILKILTFGILQQPRNLWIKRTIQMEKKYFLYYFCIDLPIHQSIHPEVAKK